MHYKINEHAFDNLKTYYPFIIDDAERYEFNEFYPYVVTAYLKDGSVVEYDDFDHTLRKLPKNKRDMTEVETVKEFGERLRRYLQFKHMTQRELSDLTGIPQTRISSYVNGKTSPGIYAVDKIARALDCPVDAFRYI